MQYAGLKRVTQPPVEPVSLAEAKAHIRVDSEDDDALIQGLIASAREWVENHLDRTLIRTQWQMRLDYFPHTISLPRPPFTQEQHLQSVAISYTDAMGSVIVLPASNYRVLGDRTPAVVMPPYSGSWPSARYDSDSIAVTWWAGYGPDQNTVPRAIKHAMLMLVGFWYENRMAVAVGAGITVTPLGFSVESLLAAHKWGSYQ
jgi:uncharacterized phiE125 gp8 family phage protein